MTGNTPHYPGASYGPWPGVSWMSGLIFAHSDGLLEWSTTFQHTVFGKTKFMHIGHVLVEYGALGFGGLV